MKKILASLVAVVTLLSATVPVAFAASVPSSFTVSVTLNAICTANNSATTTLGFGTYTAFGAAASGSTALTFTCTRGLTTPTFSFDTSSFGVIAGLNYSLAATTTNVAGSAATAVAGGIGTADARTVTVTGTMPSGQAGDCVGTTETACKTAAVTQTRTLTVTY